MPMLQCPRCKNVIDVSTGNICPFCGTVLTAPQAVSTPKASRPAYGPAIIGLVYGILAVLLVIYDTVECAARTQTLPELIARMSHSHLPIAALVSIPGVICGCVATGRKMPKKAIAIVGLVLSATVQVLCIVARFVR